MSFKVPDDDDESSVLSTPDHSRHAKVKGLFDFGNLPSTTPAAPPPPHASSTPAGTPSASFMGSSLMKAVGASNSKNPFSLSGMDDKTPPVKNPFAGAGSAPKTNPTAPAPPKNLFAAKQKQKSKAPLGRSVRSSTTRKPSRLREEVLDRDDDDEGDEEDEENATTRTGGGSFQVDYGNDSDDEYDKSDEAEEEQDDAPVTSRNRSAKAFMEHFDEYSDGEGEEDAGEGDMWLDMEHDEQDENGEAMDDSDLMMLQTPAADEKVFREAEGIFRATAQRSGGRRHSFTIASIAKDLCSQANYATITEPPELILDTESLITRLYKDGVGAEEDDERLDGTLATISGKLIGLWKQYVDTLPLQSEEHAAEIGPAPQCLPFEKATYVATLALQIHHTRTGEDSRTTEPLPESLFRWLAEHHNPYPAQVQEVLHCKPCPASHSMFWPTVCMALLRGQVAGAQALLENAGWESVKANRRGELEYSGRALDNVRFATQDTINMLDLCPGKKGNWDISHDEWKMFRVKARGSLDHLRRFAEGKNRMVMDDEMSDDFQSLTAAARKAESQVPWEIYENLNVIFEIALGAQDVILDTAQDWCEATVGLFGWWDETRSQKGDRLFRSQALRIGPQAMGFEGYMERLAHSFQTAVASDFSFNSLNPVEVGMACVFEDNAKAVVALLRTWSLPVAAAVAEIASLGRWLPQHQPSALYAFDDLDPEDLAVLGVKPGDPDETDGIKDNTLIQYAQELSNCKELASVRDNYGVSRDGWEVAIHVLGRMDSPQRSEETVGELVVNILEEMDVESTEMVDKVWRLLNELGMVQFAEQVAERFGDLLKETCFRYGEAMWYYALSHRPAKVRDVMHFLIAYSLIQSAAYPPTSELDDHLRQLLKQRNSTLERLARQDLEAAELLGKMLAGYATLRKFYEIRDDESLPLARRQKSAAAALTIVIASSDDNIRGGLYDASRDAIVGEDFLLALLGEALVFVDHNQRGAGSSPLITLEQLDVLLKAVEDIQTVGSRVYETCKDFFQLVLASAPKLLKGSTPADLMKKSTEKGSMVLTGSSMLASQLHRSVAGASPGKGSAVAPKGNAKRGWDWRSGLDYSTSAEQVLRILRLGLTRDLAKLWLAEADGGML
ncbi:nuclear pore complex subunit Nup85 [Diaporthe helianthi]|uniref:Nuclear pore complex protein Nup85 n=1 Tax=Diaporthe helianthi TaxID=158607 RepID=A0A2P5HNE0_DIAHE|nr:nuclear pore complex subunit Nup85 [Diaporthe helianthi]